jgi:ATP-dependent RNA helicase RhlE
MQFEDLQLIDSLLRAVREEGYDTPTPIQQQSIPYVLEGRDLLGTAQTGTGKTAAFALPILQQLVDTTHSKDKRRPIRALVIAPTRELATQIYESFRAYGQYTGLKYAVVFGGVGKQPQIDKLRRGIDVLVATPGRLLDLKNDGYVRLNNTEILVLDEADRMLDMGFLPDVKRIVTAVANRRQTLLFSATMPPDIVDLAHSILNDPAEVAVTPEQPTVEAIEQSVYFVEKNDKRKLLEYVLEHESVTRALIFTRTKHGANRLVKQLGQSRVNAQAIHGNKSQTAREQALANFKKGKIRVLVATDIAARGIDVEDISHVINYEIPNETETYVHRIGRTGRAGADGKAFSFCAQDERDYLRDIERLIRMHVPVVEEHPFSSDLGLPRPTDLNWSRGGNNRNGNKPSYSQKKQSNNGGNGNRNRSGNRNRNRNRSRSKSQG